MKIYKYLIGILKIGSDVLGLPDLYSYFLFKFGFSGWITLLPITLVCDIILNFFPGTSFLYDFISFFILRGAAKIFPFLDHVIFFYIARQGSLYFLGSSLFSVVSQILYGIFFVLIARFF